MSSTPGVMYRWAGNEKKKKNQKSILNTAKRMKKQVY